MYEKYLALLEKTGETTYQVCKATGVSQTTMSNWKNRQENGGKLSVDNLARIAKHFHVPLDYFLEES